MRLGMIYLTNLRYLKHCKINSTGFRLTTKCIQRIVFQRNYVSSVKNNGGLVGGNKSDDETPQSVESLLKNAASFKDDESKTPEELWSSSAYPKGANPAHALKSSHPSIDPKDTTVILFPGQGSQFVGMGKGLIEYPNVKEMFEIASEVLKYDLKQLCFEGPVSELNKTAYCQPAILVTSLAAVEKLKVDKPEAIENCRAAAGFSVGEFSALVFADCISFEDAISVMKVRAEAMQLASEIVPSGMMTVFFGADNRVTYACSVAKQWCRKLGIENPECRIANYLHPTCKVIAGNEEALQFIEMNAKDFGIRSLKRLRVSGAFHTDLMIPAEEPLRKALSRIEIKSPLIAVHSNVDGKQYKNEKHIYRGLIEQISSPVKWEQILHMLYERNQDTNYPQTYECGPGNQLRTILKHVNGKAFAKCESVRI